MKDHPTRQADFPRTTDGPEPVRLSKTDELKIAKIGSALQQIHGEPIAAELPTELQDLLKLLS